MRRSIRVALALAIVALIAGCATVRDDIRLARQGATSLEGGDYDTAENYLVEALAINPNNTSVLLNLGVVYQNTERPELARMMYLRLIRLARNARAAQVARTQGNGPPPVGLARKNLADLNLEISAVDSAPKRSADAANSGRMLAPLAMNDYDQLNGYLTGIYANLKAMTDNLSAMSDTLRRASAAAEQPGSKEKVASKPTPHKVARAAEAVLERAKATTPAKKLAAKSASKPARIVPAEKAGALRVHLASFRTAERARHGWKVLLEEHGVLLGGLDLDVKRVDFGAGMGVFFRVRAGPLTSEAAAKDLCTKLKAENLYCAVSYF